MRARFRMFAARDLLRRKLYIGETADDRWFVYMDTTLTKSIEAVEVINIWEAIAIWKQFGEGDEETKRARQALHEELARNPALREVHDSYVDSVWELVV